MNSVRVGGTKYQNTIPNRKSSWMPKETNETEDYSRRLLDIGRSVGKAAKIMDACNWRTCQAHNTHCLLLFKHL